MTFTEVKNVGSGDTNIVYKSWKRKEHHGNNRSDAVSQFVSNINWCWQHLHPHSLLPNETQHKNMLNEKKRGVSVKPNCCCVTHGTTCSRPECQQVLFLLLLQNQCHSVKDWKYSIPPLFCEHQLISIRVTPDAFVRHLLVHITLCC